MENVIRKLAKSHIFVLIFAFVLVMLLSVSAQAKPMAANAALGDIYISEVYEANGGTVKYVELYNAGATAVDLDDAAADVALRRYTNAGASPSATIDLTGTIPAGGFYVVGDPSVDTIFGTGTLDQPSTNINHNGNDKYELYDVTGTSVLDAFASDNIGDAANFAVNVVAYRVASQLPNNGNWGSNSQPPNDSDSTSNYWHVFNITSGNANALTVASPGSGTGLEAPLSTPQLLITEVVVTPTAGEFVEIYNPGGTAVDLSNVYLTDATYDGSSGGSATYYYNVVTDTDAGGGAFGDFHARFPDGSSIAAGEYQTIALTGSGPFNTTYGFLPTYELFIDAAVDGVPAMREAVAGSINGQGGLTNSGEVAILYYWDGATDLVTDLDYTIWGDTAEAVDKTGVSIDGPDGDAVTSSYLADTALGSQILLGASAHPSGNSWQREDLTEGTETKAGGNGAGGHDETSENLSDTFCTFTPTPNAVTQCPAPTATPLFIHEIQGSGPSVTSPNTNATITGVVIGDYQGSDELSGFFVQEEDTDADGNLDTSEGIFVYCGACTVDVAEGDIVEVTGLQVEFNDMSQIDVVTSAIGAVTVIDANDNSGLVTAVSVDLPAPASTTDEATFENIEGMLVIFSDELTVTEYFELGRYGQIVLSEGGKLRQFTDTDAPDATGYANHQAEVATRRIILDDLNNDQNIDLVYHPQPGGFSVSNYVRGGYTVTDLTGVMHWSFPGSGANTWRIRPQITNPVSFTDSNPREVAPTLAPTAVLGDIKVASFNVLNYFTTIDVTASNNTGDCGASGTLDCRGADSASELVRQRDKIVAAMAIIDADIIGLMEIENDDTGAAMADLVTALNTAVGGGTYAAINPGGFVGGDAITVAIIYKPGVVTPQGSLAILDSAAFTDPNSTGSEKNRPALAQTFEVTDGGNGSFGEAFTFVVNHYKSKGSGCGGGDDDTTTGQGNCNGTRTGASTALLAWLATDPTDTVGNLGALDTDFLIGGDLNAYRMEDPITTLKDAGYTDLVDSFEGANAYSYVFSGEWGYLDHSLSSVSLTPQVVDVDVWHINADEVNLLDYNDIIQDAGEAFFEAKPPTNPLYAADQYRASDHDPVIVGLSLSNIDTGSLPLYGAAWHTYNNQWLGNVWTVDDGVTRLGNPWTIGATVGIQVEVTNGPGWLACWFDWDTNNVFDAVERNVDQAVTNGSNSINFIVPANAQTGTGVTLNARCRLYPSEPVCRTPSSTGQQVDAASCQAPGTLVSLADPYGPVAGGEVEDYAFKFGPTAVTLQGIGAQQATLVWPFVLLLGLSLMVGIVVLRKRSLLEK